MTDPTKRDDHPIAGLRVMAVVRWLLLVSVAAIALGTWWTYVLRAEPEVSGEARYYCPMHPQITSPVPGTCPICSMRLEPIPEERGAPAAVADHDHDHEPALTDAVAPVMLTTERRQLAGIASVAVRRARSGGEMRLPASIATREGAFSEVRVRVPAFVERAAIRETGVRVRAGQPLAWVYAPEIVQAQEELLVASRWSAAGTSAASGAALAQSARQRLAFLGMSESDIDGVVAAGRATRAIPVRAPASGWVTERTAVVGAYASPETPLYVVADLARVWIVASAYADQLGPLEPGARARFVPRTGPPIDVVLERVVPAIQGPARTLEIRFVAENRDLALLPGGLGEISLELGASDQLIVPRDAVLDTGAAQYVFVERGGGLFEPRQVVVGPLLADQRAILSGLEEGERVVARGTFVLDSESRLSAALAPRDEAAQ